jgi:hypothetical protein
MIRYILNNQKAHANLVAIISLLMLLEEIRLQET